VTNRRTAGITARDLLRPRALLAYVVIGIAIGVGVAVFQSSTRSHRNSARADISITRVSPGTPAPAMALWLFGAATVRIPPGRVRSGSVLSIQGFGDVLGAPGAVDLFDPARGTLGRLRARTNTLQRLAPVPVAPGAAQSPQPIADTGDALWLATAPTELTRVDIAGQRPNITTSLAARDESSVTLAWSDRSGVWAATRRPGATTVARLDPATAQVVAQTTVPSPTPVVSFAGTPSSLVLAFERSTVIVRKRDLAVSPARAILGVPDLDVVTLAAVAGRTWVLDRSSAQLMQLDRARRRVVRRVPVQGSSGALRGPYGLAASPVALWVVAPADRQRFGAVRVTRVSPASGHVTARFTAPAALEVGAIALSSPDARP
jgi:hypothetical protein